MRPFPVSSPFDLVILSFSLFAAALVLVPLLHRRPRTFIRISFSLTAAAALAACLAGIWGVAQGVTEAWILGIGLPGLPFHLRLDPLSGFFFTVIGLLGFYVSIYSIGYCEGLAGQNSPTRLVVFYCLFLVGMLLVVLADDAFLFLVAWELMAASSYFLVMFEDGRAANRRAAHLYLVVTHVGAIAILLSFGILSGVAADVNHPQNPLMDLSGYTFDAMRQSQLSPGWATAAFLLSFFGFAAKAGVVPLHAWLPEAHPVAPSNVSALMSGVMLKTAIYGIVRVTFDLLEVFPWWWGGLVLILGLISAVMGVLYALMQHDLKRLLAYHSVENIGIILIGIGLAMIFTANHFPVLAALALIAGLYHTLNHALFKGLLFMGAGAVLHATHQRNMEEMGGLIHRLPWTSALFLVGCISISALPPFNGFVSEWLTFQAFLLSPSQETPMLNLLIPLGATLLALSGALAAACFVKAFGVTFLGQWRGHQPLSRIHEVPWSMRVGMLLPAVTCLIFGILPTTFIQWMGVLSEELVGGKIASSAGAFGWLWLTPVSHQRASYSGVIVFLGVISIVVLGFLFLHTRKTTLHRAPLWDCGFEKMTPRMQVTAIAFSMPIRRIFGFLFRIREQVRVVPRPGGVAPPMLRYRLRVRDRFWGWLYQPTIDASLWVSKKFGRLQQGRIQVYLVYSFVTIIVLLLISR